MGFKLTSPIDRKDPLGSGQVWPVAKCEHRKIINDCPHNYFKRWL